MENAFNENAAKDFVERYPDIPYEFALRIYTSRLIGSEPDLVLHGGGNTSIKLKAKNIVGEEEEVLYIKGSGVDLASIEPEGFSAVDLTFLRKLRNVESFSDEEMETQMQIHKLELSSLNPSVESLLHAFLPHKYVDHTHADNVLVLTNQKQGEDIVKKVLGSKVAVLPYTMSGLPLAKEVISQYEKDTKIEAIVILNHGIFSFGEDAETSYARMIKYVNRAEAFVQEGIRGEMLMTPRVDIAPWREIAVSAARVAQSVRGACAHRTNDGSLRRFYVATRNTSDLVKVSLSKEAGKLCRSGVLTPDHFFACRVCLERDRFGFRTVGIAADFRV